MNNQDDSELSQKPEVESSSATDESDLATKSQDLEELRKKSSENWDLFLRARADADNFRRRAIIDVENAHKYGIEKLARSLLDVVDSLELGLASTTEEGEKALREGMELTYKLLIDTLDKFGIKRVDPLGHDFDPKLHEALSAQVTPESEPNKVIMVVQKGFTIHDRLLRPARVIVSKSQ